MEIAKYDEQCFLKLKHLKKKNKDLLKKYSYLKIKQNSNKHFKGVVAEYENYIKLLKDKQEKQYNLLESLSEDIDDITHKTKLSEQILSESVYDQKKIINKMSDIKKNIVSITKLLE